MLDNCASATDLLTGQRKKKNNNNKKKNRKGNNTLQPNDGAVGNPIFEKAISQGYISNKVDRAPFAPLACEDDSS